MTDDAEKQENERLREMLRCLESRLTKYESAIRLDRLLNGPQRHFSPEEIQTEVERLLTVCAEQGVNAVVNEVCSCRELLEALADACHRAGFTSAGQYLTYLAGPW